MATIESIRPSISSMSDDEAMLIHMAIRQSRRTVKPHTMSVAKTRRVSEKKGLLDMVDSMSPEEAEAMLKQLEGF